ANTGRAVIGGGLKIGLKAATLGVIDAADIEELSAVAKDIADEVGTKTDAYIKALLIRHADAQKSVESVRAALSELVMSLPESPDSPSKENPPQLIFIIDELDRCKPTFALEIIEKIKHIFSVPGIHFLIVTHLKQLENSVRYSYGADIDSQTYLQKFYNLIVHLPGDGTHEHESIAARYFAYLKPRLNHDEGALNFIATVGQARNLTLRPIEKMAVYASLGIAFTTSSKMEWFRAPPILGGLCALKVLDPDLFQKAKSGTLTFEEAANAFRFERWPQTSKNDWAKSWWQYALDPSIDVTSEEWRGWGRGEFRFDKRSDMVRFVAESVIDRMEIPKE
ncbi:MAG TPA: P-loop NTPase fold protein, partial [Pseudolabrys sp.]|nr:P-loop NTPase fold protein [Pseudolabrys sp.]